MSSHRDCSRDKGCILYLDERFQPKGMGICWMDAYRDGKGTKEAQIQVKKFGM